MAQSIDEQFFWACFRGTLESVKSLSTNPGLNVNWQDNLGFSPLAAACQEDKPKVVEHLFTLAAVDVNLTQAEGQTPLAIATSKGHRAVVQLLLGNPKLQPNIANGEGVTPLYIACQLNLREIVELLMTDPRVDVNAWTSSLTTPLCVAVQNGFTYVVQYMLASGRDLDTKKKTAGEGGGWWNNKSPAEIAKHQATRQQQERESETEYSKKKAAGTAITQYFEAYEKDIIKARAQFRTQLKIEESRLEKFLGLQLSVCTRLLPVDSPSVIAVESVILADSCLLELPARLSAFANMTELDVSWNALGGASSFLEKFTAAALGTLMRVGSTVGIPEHNGQLIASLLKNCPKLKSVNLLNTNLGPSGLLPVIQALVVNFSLGNYVLESLRVDDLKLNSFADLDTIPIDILQQGTRKIVQYMLDLFSSPEAPPLYRSKLMVVGFENVGKTTILDCLFPLTSWAETMGKVKRTKYWCKLQGSIFTKYNSPEDPQPHKGRVVYIENRQWEVSLLPKSNGLKIVCKKKGDEDELELHFADRETCDVWFSRFKKVCMNEATHGIEIQTVTVKNDCTDEYFAAKKVADRGKGVLELSVWDFAGQHDYYNNHHHFLSARSVFLVLWKLSDPAGLKGLEFWLRSLATHLAPPSGAKPTGIYFSIVVIGTFLDHPSVKKEEKAQRAEKVDQLAKECGLNFTEVQYFEVSCGPTQENMTLLQDAVVKTALSHSYMGERVPMKYISISEYLGKALAKLTAPRKDEKPEVRTPSLDNKSPSMDSVSSKEMGIAIGHTEIPILKIAELVVHFEDEGMVQRALSLLSMWGECIYFDSPPDLAALVVLDPKFLAKGILADLFASTETNKGMKKNGIMTNANLVHVWSRFKGKNTSAEDFAVLCRTFLTLLEKLDVCFVLGADHEMEFKNQRTVIPALLPDIPLKDIPGGHFLNHWPKDPPHNQPIQIERVLKFTVVPSELVSRLLVHLHDYIVENLVAKNEVLILVRKMENTKGWIRVEESTNRFFVLIRGNDGKECIKLLDFVVTQVREIALKYKALSWEEAVRSPYYSRAEIDIKSISADAARALDKRELECPDMKLPLRAEKLLLRAGLLEKFNPQKVASWWDWGGNTAGLRERKMVNLIAEANAERTDIKVVDQLLFDKFKLLFAHVGGKVEKVTKVYVIDNPRQRVSFENYRKDLTEKHSDNEELFRREDWRGQFDAHQKKGTLLLLNEKISKFRSLFNDGTKAHALPVVQGTSENAAFRIVKNGFGTVASVDDGYYGHGMYFTSNLKYASKYAHFTPHGKVFMIAMTIPGNAYPVTEPPFEGRSLLGQACRKGYQSHYVGVRVDGLPVKKEGVARDTEIYADELVVFEGWQTLPLFLVYTEEHGKSTALDETAHTIASAESLPKGWNFLDQAAVGIKESVSTRQLEDLKLVIDVVDLESEDLNEEKALLRLHIKNMEEEIVSREDTVRKLELRIKELEADNKSLVERDKAHVLLLAEKDGEIKALRS